MTQTPVLIAGGGPVGMTLALELAHHGVRSMLVERNPSTTRHPKMDLTNGRSMELFRRMGLADKLRAVGVPVANPFDVVWATSGLGYLLHRFEYPSAAEWVKLAAARNDGTQTREAPMRVSQILLEPVLKAEIEKNPLIDARFGWAFESIQQNTDAVVSVVKNSATNETETISSDYLAGCDGGGSKVREAVGIKLNGQYAVGYVYMIHFRSSARDALAHFGIAWHLQTALGTLVAQDDADTWTLHVPMPPTFNAETDSAGLDPSALLRAFVGRDFPHEILIANLWTPHLLVADRYRDNRVLLVGDAAHQFIPTGGYGMNTGVGDAVDAGWKLAATLNGWAGPALLDSYDPERRAIAEQNRRAAGDNFGVRVRIAEAFMAALAEGPLEADDAAGAARRQKLGARIAELGNGENESWGIEHGFRYESSPVIASEAGTPPTFDTLHCRPSTWPGSRLPHLFLKDGRALFDQLGPEFTLLVIGNPDTAAFSQAADTLRVPLTLVKLTDEPGLRLLEKSLVLVRPDQHVAWRGDQLPANAETILAQAVGRTA